jgi:hypothetical protein
MQSKQEVFRLRQEMTRAVNDAREGEDKLRKQVYMCLYVCKLFVHNICLYVCV